MGAKHCTCRCIVAVDADDNVKVGRLLLCPLHSAAPELLEALVLMLNIDAVVPAVAESYRKQAIAAIAKAEGK